MAQENLFGIVTVVYPQSAGWKEPTTSREAAPADPGAIRLQVRQALIAYGDLSADACAQKLGLSVLTVRPRFSELHALGQIADTGQRAVNASGKSAKVWRLVKG